MPVIAVIHMATSFTDNNETSQDHFLFTTLADALDKEKPAIKTYYAILFFNFDFLVPCKVCSKSLGLCPKWLVDNITLPSEGQLGKSNM